MRRAQHTQQQQLVRMPQQLLLLKPTKQLLATQVSGNHDKYLIFIPVIIMTKLANLLSFSYGREYEPYLGHSIGPVTGYGVSYITEIILSLIKCYFISFQTVYRSTPYNRFTPY